MPWNELLSAQITKVKKAKKRETQKNFRPDFFFSEANIKIKRI